MKSVMRGRGKDGDGRDMLFVCVRLFLAGPGVCFSSKIERAGLDEREVREVERERG